MAENPAWLLASLGRMLADPRQDPTWRNYCVQHLANHAQLHREPEAFRLLDAALLSDEAEVREGAVWNLARLAEQAGAEDAPQRRVVAEAAIERGLAEGEHLLVRDAAIRAVGLLACDQHLPVLRRLAADPAAAGQLRLAAVEVLGLRGDAASAELLRTLAADPLPVLAQAARRAGERLASSPIPSPGVSKP